MKVIDARIDSARLRELQSPSDPDDPPVLASAADFVGDHRPPACVIDGIVRRRHLYTLTACTGGGKTAVALTVGVHVATGRPIGGRRVDPGNVIYLAAENADDVRTRLIYTCDRLGVDPKRLRMHFVERPFDIDRWFDEVNRKVHRLGGAALVVTDTGPAFLAAFGVDDENANMPMLRFARAMRRITELPGSPAHLVLWHPTKSLQAKGQLLPRGGGALLAEVDGNLCIELDHDTKVAIVHWAGKLRGPDFEPLRFRLEAGTCSRLFDAAGHPVHSVCAIPVDGTAAGNPDRPKSGA